MMSQISLAGWASVNAAARVQKVLKGEDWDFQFDIDSINLDVESVED